MPWMRRSAPSLMLAADVNDPTSMLNLTFF
ncbi:hypothetical protein SPHS6_03220 [Sphingobium sp. S6]|nr:hypothetical protein SPHS8_02909 [Sphingobium sp. S8]CAD7340867.1 hypothetical protein SPHS6_03220 [Sphingobium sp. S6]